jgi:hypothetical protein
VRGGGVSCEVICGRVRFSGLRVGAIKGGVKGGGVKGEERRNRE